jgi:prepilin signal peptidase PulO-like enzyme (type II secretory pathway)
MNTGKTLGGRSMCMSCGKTLHWYELIPVISFFYQNGKCTKCKSVISWQYPLVEIATGLLFLLLVFKFLPLSIIFGNAIFSPLIFYFAIFCILIVISAYDIRHKIIPDGAVAIFILLAFLSRIIAFFPEFSLIAPDLGVLYSLLVPLPFVFLWVISGGRWIGLGDAKLALGIGLLLGWNPGLLAVIFAFWIGALVSVKILLLKKYGATMKSEVPFGPFLAIATFIVFIFHLDIMSFINLFVR